MKVGVISDTHIPLFCSELPAAVMAHFQDVAAIIHAGDIVEAAVLEALRALCPRVEAVCGNMDVGMLSTMLPKKKLVVVGKHRIGVIHGWGAPGTMTPEILLREFKSDRPDVIVFGHSHRVFNQTHNGILYLNPGSATDYICGSPPSIALLELEPRLQAQIIAIS